jgi:hypothetical protein
MTKQVATIYKNEYGLSIASTGVNGSKPTVSTVGGVMV